MDTLLNWRLRRVAKSCEVIFLRGHYYLVSGIHEVNVILNMKKTSAVVFFRHLNRFYLSLVFRMQKKKQVPSIQKSPPTPNLSCIVKLLLTHLEVLQLMGWVFTDKNIDFCWPKNLLNLSGFCGSESTLGFLAILWVIPFRNGIKILHEKSGDRFLPKSLWVVRFFNSEFPHWKFAL